MASNPTKKKKRIQVYYQINTENLSFMKVHLLLKNLGIKENRSFLKLYDKDLAYIDPLDEENLTIEQKGKVIREIKRNFFYFAREIIRIPVSGGIKRYELHRGNLALNWCLVNNLNTIIELPRQNYKTVSAAIFYLWLYNFATVNSEMAVLNKLYADAKRNLRTIKELRENLPEYLRMFDEKADINNMTNIESSTTNNKIIAKSTAIDEQGADNIGRGCTQPCQW